MEYSALPNSHDIRPDPGRLWAGGAATAIVAALIALVGVLICRWTLGIPILAPQSDGAWGSAHTGEFVLAAAVVALIATALLYLLMLGTPQPGVFLKWIMGLVTLAAIVYPFSTGAPLDQKIATAVVDLVLGVAIASLLTAVAARAVRRVDSRNVLRQGYDRRGYVEQPRGYGEPPRGYDDRGGYGSREYGRPGYERDPQGYDRPAYDRRGYDDPGGHRGYDRRESPTRQYPPQDRWS
jgi:uncharacterized protein DUF6069